MGSIFMATNTLACRIRTDQLLYYVRNTTENPNTEVSDVNLQQINCTMKLVKYNRYFPDSESHQSSPIAWFHLSILVILHGSNPKPYLITKPFFTAKLYGTLFESLVMIAIPKIIRRIRSIVISQHASSMKQQVCTRVQ